MNPHTCPEHDVSSRCEFHCIREQIMKDLPQTQWIAANKLWQSLYIGCDKI